MLDSNTRFHCFFEQSGTFKKEFVSLGYQAFDYDILNDFGQTDFNVDLFSQIRSASLGHQSIFDDFDVSKDFIIAFFPCVRFSKNFELCIRAEQPQLRKLSISERIKRSMLFEKDRSDFYDLFCSFVIICIERGLRCVIENPYDQLHYLYRYFPLKPAIVDMNRRDMGDYFKKPTQYFFLNCVPSYNFIFESVPKAPSKSVNFCNQVERSLMSPYYANRFIREFIL